MSEPVVTRTRQDLINSGDAFKMRGAFSPTTTGSQEFRGSSSNNNNNNNLDPNSSHPNHSHHNQIYKPNSKRKLNECCYSISNLALIIASVIALFVLIKFVQDDALYEYGEFLLSLNFYRKLTYTICLCVLLPLILLIPIFNALSVFLLSDKHKYGQVGESILKLKLLYHALMFVLVLVALVIVAPYIRPANLSAQIELELRRHMNYRYQHEFSYIFLDTIQETFECCDELWYRAQFGDKLPTSCFVPGSQMSLVYDQTCSQAISSVVSTRCAIVAACLMAILLALACLFAVDLLDLLSIKSSRHHYKVSATNGYGGDTMAASQHSQRTGSFKQRNEDPLQRRLQPATVSDDEDDQADPFDGAPGHADRGQSPSSADRRDEEHVALTQAKSPPPTTTTAPTSYASGSNRLREEERQREAPLLAADDDRNWKRPATARPTADDKPSSYSSSDRWRLPPVHLPAHLSSSTVEVISSSSSVAEQQQLVGRGPSASSEQDPILLARANYQHVQRERSQSPVFRTIVDEYVEAGASNKPAVPSKPIKSALKKTSSNQNLDGGTGASSARRRTSQDGSHSADDDDDEGGGGGHRDPSRLSPNARGTLARQDFDDVDADADSLDEYAEKLRQSTSLLRQEPTRRSLLSVRFAE